MSVPTSPDEASAPDGVKVVRVLQSPFWEVELDPLYIQLIVIIVMILVAMIASFLAGINYVRRRDHRGDPGLPQELQEPFIHEDENATHHLGSVTSILNQSGERSNSTDGLGCPETHEGDIITPLHTPRLPNGDRVESSNGRVASWLTPGQVAYLQGEGYYVFSDAEVNQRRTSLQESMPPSIEEVMTPELVQALVDGTLSPDRHFPVPLDAQEWNGVHPEVRAAKTKLLEDSLILGIEMDEMTVERGAEAHDLRARLRRRTVREVEASFRERRAQTDL